MAEMDMKATVVVIVSCCAKRTRKNVMNFNFYTSGGIANIAGTVAWANAVTSTTTFRMSYPFGWGAQATIVSYSAQNNVIKSDTITGGTRSSQTPIIAQGPPVIRRTTITYCLTAHPTIPHPVYGDCVTAEAYNPYSF